MMRIHLRSIRQFYPAAPILVSKKGAGHAEIEALTAEFGIRCWFEECNYVQALLNLLKRCTSQYVCILDHDTVLLSTLDPYLDGLQQGHYDLVGIEERIRFPDRDDWLRFAPGYMDATFLLFDLRRFLNTWGLRGIKRKRTVGTWHREYHYGICQKLSRHKYLYPYHTRKYGFGNLLMDGRTAVLWHQWYGSYRKRAMSTFQTGATVDEAAGGESAFLADYPNLDLIDLKPAWGPGCDIRAQQLAARRGLCAKLKGLINRSLAKIGLICSNA